MVDQMYYAEYRHDGELRADGVTRFPTTVKSFGRCIKPATLAALHRALGREDGYYQLDGTDACNAPGLADFQVQIPGTVLWGRAPAHFEPDHVTRGQALTIDLYDIRRRLITTNMSV